MSLPPELWFLILSHCDLPSSVCLGQVSHVLFSIFRSDSFSSTLRQSVETTNPFMIPSDDGIEPTNWLECALVLSKRLGRSRLSLNEFVGSLGDTNEFNYLEGLKGLPTLDYHSGMLQLIKTDETNFRRQMVVRKVRSKISEMLGGQEVTFFDNSVELVAKADTEMLITPWKLGGLDFESSWRVYLDEENLVVGEEHVTEVDYVINELLQVEIETKWTVKQLARHTLIVRSRGEKHNFSLLRNHTKTHLFHVTAESVPEVFDYNGYLWVAMDNQLFPVLVEISQNGVECHVTIPNPILLSNNPYPSTFSTAAETPFRNNTSLSNFKRYLLLSENPYSSCDFFVDLATRERYAATPLAETKKVFPVRNGEGLCFVRRG